MDLKQAEKQGALAFFGQKYPDKVKELEKLHNDWAKRCNVVPWSEMEIQKIPTGKNPLLRTDSLL